MSDYGFEHHGTIYTPDRSDVPAAENASRNAAIERAELAHWATQPARMVGYYHFPGYVSPGDHRADFYPPLSGTGAIVTTWLGTVLGHVISAHVYTHNFGGRFVSLRIKATNGTEYHGRASWDWGQCINLRKVRS